ncbi:MAG: hypothetical protein PHN89_05380 [Candidatus Pacebacteria bacterium]|nr:hypothetical protein [Candidatus Paceibacterota bacterium]
MSKTSRNKRLERQRKLLLNFKGDFYQEKKIGNEWYIKRWNGDVGRWEVAIYSQESYARYKQFKEIEEQNNFVKNL